jgi:hypothetical protein
MCCCMLRCSLCGDIDAACCGAVCGIIGAACSGAIDVVCVLRAVVLVWY